MRFNILNLVRSGFCRIKLGFLTANLRAGGLDGAIVADYAVGDEGLTKCVVVVRTEDGVEKGGLL